MAHSVRSIADLLQQAAQALQTGALAKAEELCRLVLKSHPKQTDALHLFAIIALESGRSTGVSAPYLRTIPTRSRPS